MPKRQVGRKREGYLGGKTVGEDGEEPVEGDCFEVDAETLQVLVDSGT